MEKWKKIGKKLLFPNIFIIILFTIISAVALFYVFSNGLEASWFAYVFYFISAYALTILVAFCCMTIPRKYRIIKHKMLKNPWGNRYLTDAAFRTHVSLYISLMINIFYVGVNGYSYWLFRSVWFIILAVYYMILAIMRFLLLEYARKKGIGKERLGELKKARFCSCILLTLNFVLSGSVLMILYHDKGFEYKGILIFAMAAYTFYITILAIVNLIRYRKYKSPVMTTTKIIALSAALVSMLSLETAMFSQFGENMSIDNQRLMIILTGAAISITVITMSSYMIVKTSREIIDYTSKEIL